MRHSKYRYVFFFLLISNYLQAQNMERVRQTLDTLCSPAFQGRGYVQKGDSVAAHYIARRFRQIGLQPQGASFFQYFKLDVNTFPEKIALKIGRQKPQIGRDYIMHESSGSYLSRKKLQLVRLDTAILNGNTMQQIIFLNNKKVGSQAIWFKSTETAKIGKLSNVVQNKLKEAGAWVEVTDKKLTASLSAKQDRPATLKIKNTAFDSTAKKVQLRVEAKMLENYRSQNVIGYLRGTVQPDSFLIISAHYDHLGRMGQEALFAGANDNASGISFLLEMADSISRKPHRYSILFIAFGAEETGLIGSKFFVEHPTIPLEKVKFVLNLDLLGTGDDGITVVNGSVYTNYFNRLTAINEQKKYLPQVRARGKAANSDHYWFSERGIPAFFVYTLGGVAAYHDIFDLPQTLPLTRYCETFGLLNEFLEELR